MSRVAVENSDTVVVAAALPVVFCNRGSFLHSFLVRYTHSRRVWRCLFFLVRFEGFSRHERSHRSSGTIARPCGFHVIPAHHGGFAEANGLATEKPGRRDCRLAVGIDEDLIRPQIYARVRANHNDIVPYMLVYRRLCGLYHFVRASRTFGCFGNRFASQDRCSRAVVSTRRNTVSINGA